MDIGAQAHVVGEIPAYVVGVFVNRYVVAVPVPAVAVRKVKRGHAKVVAAKPESTRIATLDAPAMSSTEAALEAAVFPRVVAVETFVVASPVVSDPFAVAVNVRSFGVVVAVAIRAPVVILVAVVVPVTVTIRWPMARNVSSTNVMVAIVSIVTVVSLCQGGQRREDQGGRKDAED